MRFRFGNTMHRNVQLDVKRALEGKEKINNCSSPLFHILFAVFKIGGATNFKGQRKEKAGQKHKAQYRKFPMVLGSIS